MLISAAVAKTKTDRVNSRESILDSIMAQVEFQCSLGFYETRWPLKEHKEWIENELKSLGYGITQLNNDVINIEWS